MLIVGGLCITIFPLLTLSLISKPPLYVKSRRFNKKYGTLTEDIFKNRTMYQRSYYILFLFYRLSLTFILVYMYGYPLTQIIIFFIMQVLLIGYLIKYRPFKSELQQVIVVTDELTIIFELILLYFMWKHQNSLKNSLKVCYLILGLI